MLYRMTEHLRKAFFDPERTRVPVSVVLILWSAIVSTVWFFSRLSYRVETLESWWMDKNAIYQIVKDAVASEFDKQIPKLTLQLDERYQKKNEK